MSIAPRAFPVPSHTGAYWEHRDGDAAFNAGSLFQLELEVQVWANLQGRCPRAGPGTLALPAP